MTNKKDYRGSDAIVDSLINHDVKYVFGIPGAKVDRLFEDLTHGDDPKTPQLIVTRHEQNAAFIAAGIGRITGKPGVVLTTSGPGASNLATGLVTATAEGDPVLAISGQVQRADLLRLTHQSIRSAALFEPITKYSAEVQQPENLSEVIANAYQEAISSKQGASFVSVPQDVVDAPVTTKPIAPLNRPKLGPASPAETTILAQEIKAATLPVILVGMRASSPEVTEAIRNILRVSNIPVVETFQGAGIISRELAETNFYGRVGLFRNQPGDQLLKRSDLIITVGYDPIEYEPRNWNAEGNARIIVIDDAPAQIDHNFEPEKELVGDIAQTLDFLWPYLRGYKLADSSQKYLDTLHEQLEERDVPPIQEDTVASHPLNIVQSLQNHVSDDMTVTVDVGSHYIWMARHFRSYQPRHLLFSNGMQTLGVALPWAIAAALLNPDEKVVSVAGDGGFLFSSQELETAVRLGLNIVQVIWNDGGHYDMVKFQEEMKYGTSAGVDFGPIDFVKYAESFGATGLRVNKAADLDKVMDQAFKTPGVVVVDVPVDYSDNKELGQSLLADQL
ncbi:als protein [Agrilactobacillus composti DSM 18527 = JCM 14202]|uniref:Als protein n=1 Tax=Agrilactobacillus composti DSM 18527 = JCM 14202 TaxID=1423734 RepID=A0A0R1Y1M1_9LACO|nr:acetolactate synthase AlsS [Agrilactobacillus composti]KRM36095.1 als protein [Agrilactobacillus composti DSM 18527 = JCM 14202]